ncbi:uncharacterized protein Dana_GF27222 [Drosophila ananassae]|uniref:Kazal-like domain-containing protein n=1 Tax=Drosophila ananassae TaxID=7217 RepID=A0A0P9ALW9_DROAN|nr:uncharacterized protein Dana_GF27222 [Drosophila ananassae]
MRFYCSVILFLALFALGRAEKDIECPNNCGAEFDVHCGTDGTCYHANLSSCLVKLQSCYREKRGLAPFKIIERGYCLLNKPMCEHFLE